MQADIQVLTRRSAVDRSWVDKFAALPAANISDSMSRLIVCAPQGDVQAIYDNAAAKFRHESETFAAIGRGDDDAAGYRARLTQLGCYFEE
ncbi:hypothetical protein [Variovorax sp. efr-133-TYG-130]|uniref:hypothetical protein n=1 Tax=Variovorax sp. efr-133-TYG-130 TaxID=3040327 RepID=UPI0025548783|nr:hypothetical protein [Variovorax sp. efr-133-TYG-130]